MIAMLSARQVTPPTGKCKKVNSHVKSKFFVAWARALLFLAPWDWRATSPAFGYVYRPVQIRREILLH